MSDTTKNTPLQPESEKELEALIAKRIEIATTKTKSDDPIVQIAWLAQGIDLWHRSDKKRGHSPEKAIGYIISSITRHIQANYISKDRVRAAVEGKRIEWMKHEAEFKFDSSPETLKRIWNHMIDNISNSLGLGE